MNRPIVTAVAGLAVAGLLAGCGGSGGSGGDKASSLSSSSSSANAKDTKSGTAAPVVTLAQATAILNTYQVVNNAANKTQDAAKLGTVEAGALFQQSAAQYKQYPKFTAKVRAAYRQPFSYVDRHFFIPTSGSWFMVSAMLSGGNFAKGDRQLIVFRQLPGGHWKMVVADNYRGALPALAKGADGAPVVVGSDATVGSTRLSGLGTAVNDLRVSGGKKAGAALADNAVRRAAVKEYTDRNAHWGTYKGCLRTDFEDAGPKWDSAYTTYPDAYALRTADGGALVAGTSYFVKLEFSTRPSMCSVVPGGTTAVYLQGDRAGIRNRYASLNLISVPAAGKPIQLGGDVQLIGATS